MSRHGHRFYVQEQLAVGMKLALADETARQIASVLRLRSGDAVRLFSGDGLEYTAEIVELQRGAATVRVVDCERGIGPLTPSLSVGLALIRHERFEWALQKLTELGVDRIVPMVTERTVLSFRVDRAAQRVARWQRIVVEAAEQSGRATLPEIDAVAELTDVLASSPDARAILLWEDERAVGLSSLLDQRPVLLLIGPEGGFSPSEIELARSTGAEIASLGALTLRTETAAIASSAMMLAHRMNSRTD